MLVPIFKRILPKTLLKWAPLKYRPTTTKSRTKSNSNNKNRSITSSISNVIIETIRLKLTKIEEQYFYSLIWSWILTLASFESFALSFLIIIQICFKTVVKNLSILMNDIRIKSRYLTKKTKNGNGNSSSPTQTQTQSQSSSLAPSSSSSSSIDTKHFTNNYKNNHRTYDNSGKSHKVFLHYTPRDPRLRIFKNNQREKCILFNKHLTALESESEYKITEDLCNYGELIGGYDCGYGFDSESDSVINKRFNCNDNNNNNSNNNNNNKVIKRSATSRINSQDRIINNIIDNWENCEKLIEKEKSRENHQVFQSFVRREIRNVRNFDFGLIGRIVFTISVSY